MNSQTESLLMVGLPYAAIVIFLAGVLWRLRSRFTVSSLSSQILESRFLPWGSVPFHMGILILFLGHLLPTLLPGTWLKLVSYTGVLLAVEAVGVAAAILCLLGLVILLWRRAVSPTVRAGSTFVDFVVLAILIAQVAIGLSLATMHRWGALWSEGTTAPYLRSLATLQPEPAYVAGTPLLLTLHLVGAWVVLALIPFSRLIHIFLAPIQYLWRPPQKVMWLPKP
jgi:nitrate reductase gamma subunit